MKMNFIITKQNKTIKLNVLKDRTPSLIYSSSLYDQICFNIAKKRIADIESDDFKLYVNLLLLKSKKVKELTSLIYLITHNILDVKEIYCDYIEASFFNDFISSEYNIRYNLSFKKYNLIDTKYKYFIFPVKMILHRFYRILKNKVEYKKSFIKTYVEDTIKFYPEHIDNSTIFIYPFNLNFNRQRKFIKYCKEKYKGSYSLMGNPYSLSSYLFTLINKKGSDISVLDAEKKAYLKHSKELLNLNIKKLYTLDEFEAASFIMNTDLIKNNIFVQNKTHGVGGYCLYLNYSILEVYTSKQYERYKEWNPYLNISFQKLNIPTHKKYKNEKVKIVFMHGNMKACGLNYEEELEQKIIIKLKEISSRLNIEYFIKFHPNTTKETKLEYKHLNIKEMGSIEQINNPLFITIFSTSFYDFLKFGPFIFLSDDFLDPSYIFGKDILSFYNYNDSEEIIKSNVNLFNYESLHKLQLQYINNR
ncbi:hypothetical protein ACOL24_08610 [Aliarcobacter butzleri]|uniref:hypothetical protein n=1 Tax=Aliarcobacter butzleri TaxID=28197 RepID=UPI003AFA5F63